MFVYVNRNGNAEANGIKDKTKYTGEECYEKIIWLILGLDMKILCLTTRNLMKIFEVDNSRWLSNISRIFN